MVLDRKGERFAEVFEENQRRQWVPLSDIPEQVQKAFLAAEDKRFDRHRGIDERGLIRAFIGNLAQTRAPAGRLNHHPADREEPLVGEDLTYDRNIREMIVASRVEHTLSKAEILELYLNSVYLGRGSWGFELAARSYFGKQAKNLTLEEGALLAGLTKGRTISIPTGILDGPRNGSPTCSAACRRTKQIPRSSRSAAAPHLDFTNHVGPLVQLMSAYPPTPDLFTALPRTVETGPGCVKRHTTWVRRRHWPGSIPR